MNPSANRNKRATELVAALGELGRRPLPTLLALVVFALPGGLYAAFAGNEHFVSWSDDHQALSALVFSVWTFVWAFGFVLSTGLLSRAVGSAFLPLPVRFWQVNWKSLTALAGMLAVSLSVAILASWLAAKFAPALTLILLLAGLVLPGRIVVIPALIELRSLSAWDAVRKSGEFVTGADYALPVGGVVVIAIATSPLAGSIAGYFAATMLFAAMFVVIAAKAAVRVARQTRG